MDISPGCICLFFKWDDPTEKHVTITLSCSDRREHTETVISLSPSEENSFLLYKIDQYRHHNLVRSRRAASLVLPHKDLNRFTIQVACNGTSPITLPLTTTLSEITPGKTYYLALSTLRAFLTKDP